MSIKFELDTEEESLKFQKQFLEVFYLNKKELKKNYKFKIFNYPRGEKEIERKLFSSLKFKFSKIRTLQNFVFLY
jgi:hypothetical protein